MSCRTSMRVLPSSRMVPAASSMRATATSSSGRNTIARSVSAKVAMAGLYLSFLDLDERAHAVQERGRAPRNGGRLQGAEDLGARGAVLQGTLDVIDHRAFPHPPEGEHAERD